ncbi:MAG: putative manganese transporter [Clostridia bacterium]|nr:putative manganese transporter [Clostridia bacterium]
MLEVIEDALIDSIKLLPFLFITYLIMEYIEHKTSDKSKEAIKKSGKFGPIIGSFLGIFPQCGFSVSATNLYAARVITLGTLISVYLSTSDEMLPIFISEAVPISTIVKILAVKLIIGIIAGFLIDLFLRLKNRKKDEDEKIVDLCEKEHCHCDHGIVKSALKHTVSIFIFIIIITLLINIAIYFIGEERIASFIEINPVLGPVLAGIIGLIPNCASSVILTQLYLENIVTATTMISGLLVNAGVGLAVLFKMNKGIKQNILIVILLYAIGVISGLILQLVGINF